MIKINTGFFFEFSRGGWLGRASQVGFLAFFKAKPGLSYSEVCRSGRVETGERVGEKVAAYPKVS